MRKYVIFDFDGTLADSKHISIQILEQLADQYGFPKVGPDQIALLQKHAESVEQFQMVAGQFYQKFREALPHITLFKGIKETLYELHSSGFGLAVISSNEESNIRAYFQNQGIDFITEVYTSSNLMGKDIMIEEFCEKNALQKEEVIYVGDEMRDLIACQKTGVDMIWVRWGFGTDNQSATYYADVPADIVEYAKLEKGEEL